MDKHEQTLFWVALFGAFLGIGQLLASQDPIKPRAALGRAIVSCGIAVSSFSILAWIPDASTPLIVGVSALLASLGTSGLTMMIQRILGRGDDK